MYPVHIPFPVEDEFLQENEFALALETSVPVFVVLSSEPSSCVITLMNCGARSMARREAIKCSVFYL